MRSAGLREAHLKGANLRRAHLEGADLIGAHLEGADLRGAEGLLEIQLRDAHGDASTKLSKGLARPEHWPRVDVATDPPTPD